MKFKTIKKRAAARLVLDINEELNAVGQRDPVDRLGTFTALFSCPAPSQVESGNTQVAALKTDLERVELNRREILVKILKIGLARIEAWDVRQVAHLLALFPSAAPRLAGKPLSCYPADNEASDWLVELA